MSSIDFFYEDVGKTDIDSSLLVKHIKSLIKGENKKVGEISVIFCSDDYLLRINEEYLNHNYYTDIITFDYCENSFISGDLFISMDRIADNARKFSSTLNKELYRVVFHGLLHLAGYKDKTPEEQALMRLKEDYYLKGIDFDKKNV